MIWDTWFLMTWEMCFGLYFRQTLCQWWQTQPTSINRTELYFHMWFSPYFTNKSTGPTFLDRLEHCHGHIILGRWLKNAQELRQ